MSGRRTPGSMSPRALSPQRTLSPSRSAQGSVWHPHKLPAISAACHAMAGLNAAGMQCKASSKKACTRLSGSSCCRPGRPLSPSRTLSPARSLRADPRALSPARSLRADPRALSPARSTRGADPRALSPARFDTRALSPRCASYNSCKSCTHVCRGPCGCPAWLTLHNGDMGSRLTTAVPEASRARFGMKAQPSHEPAH